MNKILEIGDYEIELMETDLVPVTKSIYDVQNPDSRKSSFTKTISIPSSRVNNQVFMAYFDVANFIENDTQFNPYYNPSKKVKAVYYEDSLEVITGYAQLTDIIKTKEEIVYELVIYGENAEIFNKIEGLKLSDLDLSGLDHLYTKGVIRSSWSATSGYVYPQIKNGKQNDLNFGLGIIETDYWKVTDFSLWFFVKTIWDSIWESAGFNYYSNFLSTETFTKLIYKGSEDGMRRLDTEIQNSLCEYDLGVGVSKPVTANRTLLNAYTNEVLIFPILLQDNLSQYNVASGNFSVATTAEYDIHVEFNPIFKNVGSFPSIGSDWYSCIVALVDSNGLAVWQMNIGAGNPLGLPIFSTFSIGYIDKIINVRLFSGMVYRWVHITNAGIDSQGFYLTGTFPIESEIQASKFSIALNRDYEAGDLININSLLSSEMTQKDFVMGLVNMFNLYIEPYYYNPTDVNSGGYLTYLIEPRDEYYTDELIDWTKKIDYNKEFTIKPLAGAKEKFIKYTYDLDKDYHNNLYNQRTGRVYGDATIDVDNEFLKGTKEVKIPFSLMILATNSRPTDNQIRPLSTDLKDDVPQGLRNDKSKPKILYYNGLYTYDTWSFGDDVVGTNRTLETATPMASHLNGLTTIQLGLDLCFMQPDEVYYTLPNGDILLTNNTLYNVYHKRGLEEANNKNSKMLECYVNLTPLDVHNLSFRPIYEIDGNHYRLYEMIDYNGADTTKCTFLKLRGVAPITGTTGTTKGGRGTGTWGKNPDVYHETGTLNDRVYGADLVTRRNVNTGGGTIYVAPDSDNLVLFSYPTKNITTDLILTGGEGSPLYIFADTTDGAINIRLPQEEYNIGKSYIIQKTAAGNNLVIKDYLDVTFETITAATTHEYILSETQINKVR